jgi:hypothetical protein
MKNAALVRVTAMPCPVLHQVSNSTDPTAVVHEYEQCAHSGCLGPARPVVREREEKVACQAEDQVPELQLQCRICRGSRLASF